MKSHATHPTNDNEVLLHAPYGRLLTIMTKARLQKLTAIFKHLNDIATLPEALAELTHRHTAKDATHNQITETKLHKHYKHIPHHELNRAWPILDILYDAFHRCFNIQRVINCNPINLPIRANTYISHDPMDVDFGAIPYTKSAWPRTSLALPDYTVCKLKQALEQALYIAHAHRHTSPSIHILLLPNWEQNPYLAPNLHTSYVKNLTSIPYYPTSTPTPNTRRPKLITYLVSNERLSPYWTAHTFSLHYGRQ